MDYPSQLLPQSRFKYIDCALDDFILVRYFKIIEGFDDVTDPNTGELQVKYVVDPTRKIVDCSTNLLGIFELEHLNISLTQEGIKDFDVDCQPDEEVESPIFHKHFEIDNERRFFFLRIGDINNFEVDTDSQSSIFRCTISHSPVRCNFWHFLIRWQNDNSEYLHTQSEKILKNGWGKKVCSLARAIIAKNAKLNKIEAPAISPKCYIKE